MRNLPPPVLLSGRVIGILGGSFNPAHEGHRHISLYALKHLGLDAVWWMVSPQNPLKPARGMAKFEARIKSAQEAARHPKITVTDIERKLGTRYTADTLAALKQRYPNTTFIWLMGADNLRQIQRWKNWQKIFASARVAVLDRPPRKNTIKGSAAGTRFAGRLMPQESARALKKEPLPAWTILHIPLNDASSTALRKKKG